MTAPEIAERMVWDAWNSPAYCISVDSTHYMAASVFTWISSLESCSWPVFQGSVTGSNLARECLTWRKHCQQITEARELLYLNRTIRRRRRSESEEIDFLPGPRDRSAEAEFLLLDDVLFFLRTRQPGDSLLCIAVSLIWESLVSPIAFIEYRSTGVIQTDESR